MKKHPQNSGKDTSLRVVIVVPAHNEAANLRATLPDLRLKMRAATIVVVDDASTDNTADVARACGVEVLSLPINLGIGGAVQTGLKYALQEGYDVAIQFDGDGQHVAEEIPSLLKPIASEGADMVVGSRYLVDKGYRTPPMRRAGMVFSAWLTSALIGQRLTDITSGFRAWNVRALRLFSIDYPMSFPGVESSITAHYAGLMIVEVPAQFRVRHSGESSIDFWRSFYYPFKTLVAALGVVLRKNDHKPNESAGGGA